MSVDAKRSSKVSPRACARRSASSPRRGAGDRCLCDNPRDIVTQRGREAALTTRPHLIAWPFMDGRSGYVIAVNPNRARYDGLIAPGGENETRMGWDLGLCTRRMRRMAAEILVPSTVASCDLVNGTSTCSGVPGSSNHRWAFLPVKPVTSDSRRPWTDLPRSLGVSA